VKTALHWFRRDLRLCDNTALYQATITAERVIPVFVFDPKLLKAADFGIPRLAFLLESLRSLEKNIEAAGSRLILRRGAPEEELLTLVRETGAQAVFFNREYEPDVRKRDERLERNFQSVGIEVHIFKDDVIHEPSEVVKNDEKAYQIFTPFSRIWRLKPPGPVLPAAKVAVRSGTVCPRSVPIPTLNELGASLDLPMIPACEKAARQQLKDFMRTDGLQYASARDFPARDATSRLSPHLRFGTLSPRTVLSAATKAAQEHPEAKPDLDVFVNELIWRDFYRQILWHFPHVAHTSFKPETTDLKWENNEKYFAAWCEGRTGYPLVDAGMRQLNTTGWMHNRVRMVVATFLTKDLLVSWQWGERYFMQKLFDGDLASNNGGWQWSASTGTDAQPYFRIFNPTSQARKFDPEGGYIRKYVPEVDTLAYPAPIVDHARQRLKALALFRPA
jgi:deoxyribodipyrimidine photo-lyase